MKLILDVGSKISKWMYVVAGAALTFIMGITVVDVLLRALGHPFVGTYEIVAFAGSVVIGFSIPLVSWEMGNVRIEFLLEKLPKRSRKAVNIVTRLAVMALFTFVAINFFMIGREFYTAREVTSTIRIPLYPFPFGLCICAVVQVFIIFCDILKIREGSYE
ncbi:MAG: TRAP transporter small permease [Syntrophorhabdaceae bacterium]|nr:TRAP transporter small permease [Syntrophorhabdaceae bacterium]